MTEPDEPEVPERATRRTYSAQYKLRILAEYERRDRDGKGALLRREGLYRQLPVPPSLPGVAWINKPQEVTALPTAEGPRPKLREQVIAKPQRVEANILRHARLRCEVTPAGLL